MPRHIPKPELQSAQKLTAFDLSKIHFGTPLLQSATGNGRAE